MKKTVLLMAALIAAAPELFAQRVNKVSEIQNAKSLDLSIADAPVAKSAVSKVRDNAQNKNAFYYRPEGSYFVGYSNAYSGWSLTALALPPFAEVVYKNGSTTPSAAKWWVNSKDASASADASNNYVSEYGPTQIVGGALYANLAPDLVNGTDSFNIGQENAKYPQARVVCPDTLYDFTLNDYPGTGYYYGGKGPSAFFGDRTLTINNISYNQTSFEQIYPKPITSLYFDEIHALIWNISGNTTLLSDKDTLNLSIYKVVKTAEGNDSVTKELLGTMQATKADITSDNEWSGVTNGRSGIVTFYNKVDDGFGSLMNEPIIIKDAFAVKVSGFVGKKIGFYFSQAPEYMKTSETETSYTFDPATPDGASFVCEAEGQPSVNRHYIWPCYPCLTFHGVQDNAKFITSYTNDSNVKVSLEELDAPTAGGAAVSAGNDPAYLETALPFNDVSGTANYTVNIKYQDGDSEWLTLDKVDASHYIDYGYTGLAFKATALPSGKTGRRAIVTVEGKGVTSNSIVIRQGDDKTTGISSVSAQTATVSSSKAYNLAGQQVSKDFKGIIVKDGNKYFNK